MNRLARLGVLLIAASVLPACATVTRGTKTTYRVASTPDGADVEFSTGQTCVTPCKMKLKRKEGFTATVTMAGYWAETAAVASKFSGGGGVAAAGNILVGGLVGGVIDGTDGSLNSFFPRALNLTLKPRPPMAPFVHPVTSAPPLNYVETGRSTLSSADRYEQALKAAQPVRGGSAKQGWTVSD